MSSDIVIAAPSAFVAETTTTDNTPICCPAVAPSVEQVRSADNVFTQDTRDARVVAGMIGLYTSALMLHDLAVEHFNTSGDEDDEKGPRLADQPS
jgi:hypothetical protein